MRCLFGSTNTKQLQTNRLVQSELRETHLKWNKAKQIQIIIQFSLGRQYYSLKCQMLMLRITNEPEQSICALSFNSTTINKFPIFLNSMQIFFNYSRAKLRVCVCATSALIIQSLSRSASIANIEKPNGWWISWIRLNSAKWLLILFFCSDTCFEWCHNVYLFCLHNFATHFRG